METVLRFGILFIILTGCSNTSNTELLELFSKSCDKYFFGVSETQFIQTDAFDINIPLNWYYSIEKSEDGNTTYVFSEKLDTTNNLELTGQQFYSKYNNFEIISLTFSDVYPAMNYSESYKVAMDKLKKDSLVNMIKEGQAKYQNQNVNWALYNDRNFERDELSCKTFTSCVYNEKYYVWIIQQTLGDNDIEMRKCKSIDILQTIKLKV